MTDYKSVKYRDRAQCLGCKTDGAPTRLFSSVRQADLEVLREAVLELQKRIEEIAKNNSQTIIKNTKNIATNATNIANNTNTISSNATNIANNTNTITSNSTNITNNTSNIADNTAEITNLKKGTNVVGGRNIEITSGTTSYTIDLDILPPGGGAITDNSVPLWSSADGKWVAGESGDSLPTATDYGSYLYYDTTSSLWVVGSDKISLGKNAGKTTQAESAVAIGTSAGNSNQAQNSIAIGFNAGNTTQGTNSIAMGNGAGQTTQGATAIALGAGAGNTEQEDRCIALGFNAGQTKQGITSVAIGDSAGSTALGDGAVAVGKGSGLTNLGAKSVSLGCWSAGQDAANATSEFFISPESITDSTVTNTDQYRVANTLTYFRSVGPTAGRVSTQSLTSTFRFTTFEDRFLWNQFGLWNPTFNPSTWQSIPFLLTPLNNLGPVRLVNPSIGYTYVNNSNRSPSNNNDILVVDDLGRYIIVIDGIISYRTEDSGGHSTPWGVNSRITYDSGSQNYDYSFLNDGSLISFERDKSDSTGFHVYKDANLTTSNINLRFFCSKDTGGPPPANGASGSFMVSLTGTVSLTYLP